MIKNVTLFLFFTLFAQINFAQPGDKDTVFVKRTIGENEYTYDTLYFERGISNPPILVGTMVLTDSQKNFGLLNNGIELTKLSVLNGCQGGISPEESRKYPLFETVTRDENYLIVDVTISANCCYSFLGEAEMQGDTLNLISTGYGSYCSCTCCFTLQYTFDLSLLEENDNSLNYVMINGKKSAAVFIPND